MEIIIHAYLVNYLVFPVRLKLEFEVGFGSLGGRFTTEGLLQEVSMQVCGCGCVSVCRCVGVVCAGVSVQMCWCVCASVCAGVWV